MPTHGATAFGRACFGDASTSSRPCSARIASGPSGGASTWALRRGVEDAETGTPVDGVVEIAVIPPCGPDQVIAPMKLSRGSYQGSGDPIAPGVGRMDVTVGREYRASGRADITVLA
jgi:hypothetical protein